MCVWDGSLSRSGGAAHRGNVSPRTLSLHEKELLKRRKNLPCCLSSRLPAESQIVADAFDSKQHGFCRNQFQRLTNLFDSSEGILCPLHKQTRDSQFREVIGAELIRLSGRMQRIRRQQQAVGELGFLGAEHGCLTSAITLAAHEQAF